MKIKSSLLVALTSIAMMGAVPAATVNLNGTDSYLLGAGGDIVPAGSLIRIGTFAGGTDFSSLSTNLSALDAAFTEFGTAAVGVEDGGINYGGLVASSSSTNAFAGEGSSIYIWVFNSATMGGSSEHGVFTAASRNSGGGSWIFPGDVPPANQADIDVAEVVNDANVDGSVLIGSSTTGPVTKDLGGAFGDFQVNNGALQLARIPEPTSSVLLGLIGTALLFRRRK